MSAEVANRWTGWPETIARPGEVIEPLGLRERLAGVGQMLGLLHNRELDDLAGQRAVRDWMVAHPVGAEGLIWALTDCAGDSLSEFHGASSAQHLRMLTTGRLNHGYERQIADSEGFTDAEVRGYLWATPILESVLLADRRVATSRVRQLAKDRSSLWGLALGLADVALPRLREQCGTVKQWIGRQQSLSGFTAEAAVADHTGVWTATGRHVALHPSAPARQSGGPAKDWWTDLERQMAGAAAVAVERVEISQAELGSATGAALATTLLVYRNRGQWRMPYNILALLRRDPPDLRYGMLAYLTRFAWKTARETHGHTAVEAVRTAMAAARARHSDALPDNHPALGAWRANHLLWQYAWADHRARARSEAWITASAECSWGAAIELADATINWAQQAWGEATEWIYLERSHQTAIAALAMPALPPPS